MDEKQGTHVQAKQNPTFRVQSLPKWYRPSITFIILTRRPLRREPYVCVVQVVVSEGRDDAKEDVSQGNTGPFAVSDDAAVPDDALDGLDGSHLFPSVACTLDT